MADEASQATRCWGDFQSKKVPEEWVKRAEVCCVCLEKRVSRHPKKNCNIPSQQTLLRLLIERDMVNSAKKTPPNRQSNIPLPTALMAPLYDKSNGPLDHSTAIVSWNHSKFISNSSTSKYQKCTKRIVPITKCKQQWGAFKHQQEWTTWGCWSSCWHDKGGKERGKTQ